MPVSGCVDVLHNGIPDERDGLGSVSRSKRMTFVLPGTLEFRKGQDIFVDAIRLLPDCVRESCRFLLTGKLWDYHHGYWESVLATMATLPEIEYLGLLSHRDLLALIAASDVLVCCSRDEPFPLVVLEAAMLGRPSIVSTNVGTADVLGPAGACADIRERGRTGASRANALCRREQEWDGGDGRGRTKGVRTETDAGRVL